MTVCYFFPASKKCRKKDTALRKMATDSSLEFNTSTQLAGAQKGLRVFIPHESETLHFLMRWSIGQRI